MNVYYPSGWKGKPSKRSVRSPKGSRTKMTSSADLIILFCADAAEWDQYLTCCFLQSNSSLNIEHEQLENIPFPIHSTKSQRFTQAKAVLVVISPDFLDFIDTHAKEVFEVGKLLKSTQTVAMLCGIQENDITCFHKAALVTYDDWPRLVARDQDKSFVISIIRQTEQVLIRSLERQASSKTMFKLSPKKVREGNAKVFVILDKPLTEWQKVHVHLEGNGVREVQAKRKNPYTLQFVVPDNCLQSSKIVNVHVKCDDQLLGIRQLRCDSKMGELYSLLSSVNSPYELLCHVSGVSALHEVDVWLVNNFRHNLPGYGFSLFDPGHEIEKKKSDEELPTLLHFAARYGLHELTSELLQCPGASQACHLRNSRGLIPAQLANISGHNDIASMLEDFQKYIELDQNQDDKSKIKQLDVIHEPWNDSSNALYSIPRNAPLSVVPQMNIQNDTVDSDYLPMFESKQKDKASSLDNLKPQETFIVSANDSLNDKDTSLEESELDTINDQSAQHHELCESQKELIKIMELYKQGFSYTEVERKFHEWQVRYQDSSKESAEALNILRDMYKNVHRKPERKSSFTFSELRGFFNSFLGSKESTSRKSLSHKSLEKLRRAQDKHQDGDSSWRISIASSSSTNSSSSSASCDRISTVSISTCDSGTHSDSYDEITHNKKQVSQSTKMQSSVKKSENTNVQKANLPPPPPPRPPKLPVNRGIESKQPQMNHSYYQFPQQIQGVTTTDYVMADSICYTTAASEEDLSQDKLSSTTSNESLSMKLEGIPDEANDYDCVPVPVPISMKSQRRKTVSGPNSHKLLSKIIRRRNSSSTSDLSSSPVSNNKHQSSFDDYYDIPAFPLPVTKEKISWKVSPENDHQYTNSVLKPSIPNGKFNGIDISADYSIPRPHMPNSSSDPSLSSARATQDTCGDSSSETSYYNICFRSSNSDSPVNKNENKHDNIPDEVAPPPPVSSSLKEEEYYKVISVSRPVLPRTSSKCNADAISSVPTALKKDLQSQKVKSLVKMFS